MLKSLPLGREISRKSHDFLHIKVEKQQSKEATRGEHAPFFIRKAETQHDDKDDMNKTIIITYSWLHATRLSRSEMFTLSFGR